MKGSPKAGMIIQMVHGVWERGIIYQIKKHGGEGSIACSQTAISPAMTTGQTDPKCGHSVPINDWAHKGLNRQIHWPKKNPASMHLQKEGTISLVVGGLY